MIKKEPIATDATDAATVPKIKICLSRPAYRIGSTIVGTVRVTNWQESIDAKTSTDDSTITIHDSTTVQSISLAMIGRCRLDARWHDVSMLKPNGKQHQQNSTVAAFEDLPPMEKTQVIWSTEKIELLELQERSRGQWEEVRPKPIKLELLEEWVEKEEGWKVPTNIIEQDHGTPLEQQQFACTFRVHLPRNLIGHTVVATSCRYFYTIVVRVAKNNPFNADRQHIIWVQEPVIVLAADPDDDAIDSSASDVAPVHFQAVAHSSGLPFFLSASELNDCGGQLEVNLHSAALYNQLVRIRLNDPKNVQSMRVSDPLGRPVCILTMFGVGSVLYPGARVLLKFDFPRQHDTSWIPAYQVSACLQGQEFALNKWQAATRNRARSYLFATAHEYIDPECTECVSLDLLLPLSTPCTITTDCLEISIQCIVDIAVQTTTDSAGYQNLRLEIPLHVIHEKRPWEAREDDDVEEASSDPYLSFINFQDPPNGDPTNARNFVTHDIEDDLRILSLNMARDCGLR